MNSNVEVKAMRLFREPTTDAQEDMNRYWAIEREVLGFRPGVHRAVLLDALSDIHRDIMTALGDERSDA